MKQSNRAVFFENYFNYSLLLNKETLSKLHRKTIHLQKETNVKNVLINYPRYFCLILHLQNAQIHKMPLLLVQEAHA